MNLMKKTWKIILSICFLATGAGCTAQEKTVLRFGSYPQSSAKAETIEWIVLEETADSYFLLSRDSLASLPWDRTGKATAWENASLRAWLNGEFFRTAFTKTEQDAILETENVNGDDLGYGTKAGKNTRDKVFLLSGGEVKRLLPENLRTAKATAQAKKQGAYTNAGGNMAWWLRSPGMNTTSPAYLASNGDVGSRAHEMTETIIGVRPAIRVKKDALATVLSSAPLPTDAKSLYDALRGMDEKARDSLLDTTLTATGIVTYIGRDIHGLPSFRLSDTANGKCYVHACLASASEYGSVKVGDTVTVSGTFHILSNDWGVTLKGSRVQG